MLGRFGGTGSLIVAVIVAGFMALITAWIMPTIQPMLVDVATVVADIVSADADEITNIINNSVVPVLPFAIPILTFFGVLYGMSRGSKTIR